MRELTKSECDGMLRLLWPPSHESDPEYLRWYQQGFQFAASDTFHSDGWHLGLVQGQGGPCGVLAAIQAEIIRIYLFSTTDSTSFCSTNDRQQALRRPLTHDQQDQLLARAFATVLFRCAPDTATPRQLRLVWLTNSNADPLLTEQQLYAEEELVAHGPDDPHVLTAIQRRIDAFHHRNGVLNFVFSVLRSHGLDNVRQGMDDPDSCLTGRFAYCNQELVNLLLTGAATSNVFDGSMPMGDTGLMLHGIAEQSDIGYLTHLESMRYCQVGSYYKFPRVPVWVIGSVSHFSVLFGIDAEGLNTVTASEALLQRVRRVFQSYDRMETGMIDVSVLLEALLQADVAREIVMNEYNMAQLFSRLEVSGEQAGVVLWDDFWRIVSVLIHTNDLKRALNEDQSKANGQRERSDSEIARELQAQFDAEQHGQDMAAFHDNDSYNTAMNSTVIVSAASDTNSSRQKQMFVLFYYNGLQRNTTNIYPPLHQFVMTVDCQDDCIGKSVPLIQSNSTGGHGTAPLLEIIKTRWQSATLDVHDLPPID